MANKYLNINPQSIENMTESEKRKAYSELRSIARKRADRLEAAGFEARRFNPVNKVFSGDLDDELLDVADYLRTPGSSLKVAKKEREQATLAAHGYNIQDVRAFGKFMDNMRYRYRNRKLPDSGLFADIYQQAERRKMSQKTLDREFGRYLKEEQTALQLRDALESAPDNGKRLTSNGLKDLLSDVGLL